MRLWDPRPPRPRCGHKRCERTAAAAVLLALLGVLCLVISSVQPAISAGWLIAGAVFLAGWVLASLWPHPAWRPPARQRPADIEAVLDATRECPRCVHAYGTCRCTRECGHPRCDGLYARHEREMRR